MDRTYGETKNCAGCRFWSEMIAKCDGGGPVEALCLGSGKMKSKYTTGRMTCSSWVSGELGAVDQPDGTDPYSEVDAAAEDADREMGIERHWKD